MASTEGNRTEKRASAALEKIPDKLYFRIGEVARLLDLPAYVLRFWETEFPQLKPGKGGTGQRLYRHRDVELAFRIRALLYDEGYTIPGARQHLKVEGRATDTQRTSPPEAAPDSTSAAVRLRRMRSELREIASLLAHSTDSGGAQSTNVAHRGLHVAATRRRPLPPLSSSLFPDDDGTPEQS